MGRAMSDPARVAARKYADLEAERDRYRAALEEIFEAACTWAGTSAAECAFDALEGPNDAPREEGP
jgi:hypothetical protein